MSSEAAPKSAIFTEIDTQDTASNAMTELALGLSMAFFALLVLALISINLPKAVMPQNSAFDSSHLTAENTLSLAKRTQNSSLQDMATTSKNDEVNVIIYWSGKFMDSGKNEVTLPELYEQENLVLAVDPKVSIAQLMTLQKNFAGKQMQLTTLSQEWLVSLEKM